MNLVKEIQRRRTFVGSKDENCLIDLGNPKHGYRVRDNDGKLVIMVESKARLQLAENCSPETEFHVASSYELDPITVT